MLKNFYTYQKAKDFYRDCQNLKLLFPMKEQFDRALLSIVLKLAEGSGKPTRKDRKKFYAISLGSLREVQAILDLIDDQNRAVHADHLAALIYKLIQNPGGS